MGGEFAAFDRLLAAEPEYLKGKQVLARQLAGVDVVDEADDPAVDVGDRRGLGLQHGMDAADLVADLPADLEQGVGGLGQRLLLLAFFLRATGAVIH